MQDRYAGDVGDFGKFALLRFILNRTNYNLGVVWYLFPDESHNNDGGHIDYLTKPEFLRSDKYLCEMLSAIVSGTRSVAALEKGGLLPDNTVYFSEQLDFHLHYPSQRRQDKEVREIKRKEWLNQAVAKTSKCKVIFLDPDNGLQTISCPDIGRIKSGKYAYYSEVAALAKNKDVTVIYHHLNHHKNHGTHENQIQTRVAELRKRINPTGRIFALRYRPYSPRAYFILTAKTEEDRARGYLLTFKDGAHARFWDFYYEEKSL